MPYKKGYCIALDEKGKELTSIEFAKLIQDKNELSFFYRWCLWFKRRI